MLLKFLYVFFLKGEQQVISKVNAKEERNQKCYKVKVVGKRNVNEAKYQKNIKPETYRREIALLRDPHYPKITHK